MPAMAVGQRGRPRAFSHDAALRAAVDLFWRQGYASTSLDDLLRTMGISRSSFYAAWASKHEVLMAALRLYTDELHGRMRAAAAGAGDARAALAAVLEVAACSERPADGCLFVNTATELASSDADVCALAHEHLGRVDRLIASLFRDAGFPAPIARRRSVALLALAAGAVTLRKAGEPEARIRAVLETLPLLLA